MTKVGPQLDFIRILRRFFIFISFAHPKEIFDSRAPIYQIERCELNERREI